MVQTGICHSVMQAGVSNSCHDKLWAELGVPGCYWDLTVNQCYCSQRCCFL